jgi:hypothetical protein
MKSSLISSTIPWAKNHLINGAFDIWQRGTSGTVVASTPTYFVDRLRSYSVGVNHAISRVTPIISTNEYYYNYALRYANSVGTTGTRHSISQTMEAFNGANLYSKLATFSFWIRADKSYTFAANAWNGTKMFTKNFSVTTSWQRVSIIIPFTEMPNSFSGAYSYDTIITAKPLNLGADNTWNIGDVSGVTGTTYAFGATTSDWFETTGWMLNLGTVAAPFSLHSMGIGSEFTECQRFCLVLGSGNAFEVFGSGFAGGTSNAFINIPFAIRMRRAPDISTSAATDFSTTHAAISLVLASFTTQANGDLGWYFNGTHTGSGFSTNAAVIFRNQTGNAKIYISAEL